MLGIKKRTVIIVSIIIIVFVSSMIYIKYLTSTPPNNPYSSAYDVPPEQIKQAISQLLSTEGYSYSPDLISIGRTKAVNNSWLLVTATINDPAILEDSESIYIINTTDLSLSVYAYSADGFSETIDPFPAETPADVITEVKKL